MSLDALAPVLLALAALGLLLARRGQAGQQNGVQAVHLTVETIADEVISFADGRRCAVLEVGSLNFASLGEAKQREVVTGYGIVLDSLAYPVQALVRATPPDLTAYLAGREERAVREPHEQLRRIARDRNAHLRRLAGGRNFLDRRFYLIVPADPPRPATLLRLSRLPGIERGDEAIATVAAAAKQLAARCDDLARQLGRCGLTARRLTNGELAELTYACWCPELARIEQFRRDLRDYQTLVVTREGRARRAPAPDRIPVSTPARGERSAP